MEKEIINYLISIGFEIRPCSIPQNERENFKRNLLLSIKSRSEFLFRFLIKIFPIKYKYERDDKSVWFLLRNEVTKKIICEIELKPKSESIRKLMRFYYHNFDYSIWEFRVYNGPSFVFLQDDDYFYMFSQRKHRSL